MDRGFTAWLMAGTHLQISSRSAIVLFHCMNCYFTYDCYYYCYYYYYYYYYYLLAKNVSRETYTWFPCSIDQGHTYFGRTLTKTVVCEYSPPAIGSIPETFDPPLVHKAVFRMTSASMHSNFILCMDCGILSNKKCLSASLWHGCLDKVKGSIIQRHYAILHVVRKKFYGAIDITFIVQKIS